MSERDPDITRHEGTTMRRRLPAWLVMCNPASVAMAIGLVLSLAGAYAVSQWEERVTRIEFEGVAETQSIIMQNGMNEYISRLVALRTLFESANEEITRSEFEAFTGRLFERHPGILRVAWLPRVNRKERAEYEAAAITDGISGYRIKSLNADGSIATAPQSDEYYPVFFSTEPKTSMVYGLDYATAPERRATLERARDNDMIATLRDRLYRAEERRSARRRARHRSDLRQGHFADHGRRPAAQPGRIYRRRIQSPAFAALDPNNDGRKSGRPHRRLSARSRPHRAGGRRRRFLVRSSGSLVRCLLSRRSRTGPGALKIGDANWQVRATPTAGGTLIAHYYRALAVLAAGIVITAFLAAYLWLASRNTRQLARANRRVLELAQTDILTGLPNRAFFLEQLHDVNSYERRDKGRFRS